MKTLLLLAFIFLQLPIHAQDYFQVNGVVNDKALKTAVPFSSVYITGTNYCGTVSNESGEFVLKIPKNIKSDSLKISRIGYKTFTMPLHNNVDVNLGVIELEETALLMNEVIIHPLNIDKLLDIAISKIPENYDTEPVMLTGFFRQNDDVKPLDFESARYKHEHYMKEAVLEIYRSPFEKKALKAADDDLIKLIAWRKTNEINDSVFKQALSTLKGVGPEFLLNEDPLKDIKNSVLSTKNRLKYDFILKDINAFNGDTIYVIEFDQKDEIKEALYKGTITIDAKTKAFVSIEFALSPKGIQYNFFKKIGPLSLKLNKFSRKMHYKKYGNKWNLNFAESISSMDMTFYNESYLKPDFSRKYGDRKSVTFRFSSINQLAVTNVDKTNIIKFRKSELFKSSTEVKVEKNKNNSDVWGKYNYFKMPE